MSCADSDPSRSTAGVTLHVLQIAAKGQPQGVSKTFSLHLFGGLILPTVREHSSGMKSYLAGDGLQFPRLVSSGGVPCWLAQELERYSTIGDRGVDCEFRSQRFEAGVYPQW